MLKALDDYLQFESLDKKKIEQLSSDWKKENIDNVLHQNNNDDCGVSVCMFAEFVSRKRPLLFSQ